MKRSSTTVLQAIIVLIGIGALAFLLWEPTVEGVNANATLFEIYFNDPFLAYAYASSVLFFVALYNMFTVLGYVGRDDASSPHVLKAVRTIKWCTSILAALIVAAMGYMFIIVRGSDDIAGGVAMGLFFTLISLIIAGGAAVFERSLRTPRR